MNTMVNDNGLTFKDFEVKTFKMICKWGQNYTREFLEKYDEYLMENRDKYPIIHTVNNLSQKNVM